MLEAMDMGGIAMTTDMVVVGDMETSKPRFIFFREPKCSHVFFFVCFYRVSVERARGTPRGSDQWRNDRRGGSKYPPQRRRSRDK